MLYSKVSEKAFFSIRPFLYLLLVSEKPLIGILAIYLVVFNN